MYIRHGQAIMLACCKSCGTDNSPAGRLMPSNASLYITHTSLCISHTLIYHYISLIYHSCITHISLISVRPVPVPFLLAPASESFMGWVLPWVIPNPPAVEVLCFVGGPAGARPAPPPRPPPPPPPSSSSVLLCAFWLEACLCSAVEMCVCVCSAVQA